jgi:4-hydroxy-3-polyprenylbenzoate decarboxylase
MLLKEGTKINLIVSEVGTRMVREEIGIGVNRLEIERWLLDNFGRDVEHGSLSIFDNSDLKAPVASGRTATDKMVIAPCSARTVAGIAHGMSVDLIQRAADVMLKEGRPLVLVVREAPLSSIHLENMLKLSRFGSYIIPACPAFDSRPKTVEELVDSVLYKALSILRLPEKTSGVSGRGQILKWA